MTVSSLGDRVADASLLQTPPKPQKLAGGSCPQVHRPSPTLLDLGQQPRDTLLLLASSLNFHLAPPQPAWISDALGLVPSQAQQRQAWGK